MLSWGFAALFLAAFSMLGLMASSDAALFVGLPPLNLPTATNLAIGYGSIVFPILGVSSAAIFIFWKDSGRGEWRKMALGGIVSLFALWCLKQMIFSYFGPPLRVGNL